MSYAYELHGWLKGITTNSFKEDLFYADCPDSTYNCYNGNIGTMRWSNSNYEQIRGYKFVYDNANRLTDALYGERANLNNKVNRYNEVLEYDENGNITSLQRRGLKQDGQYGKIDNLNLKYDGNQLFSVEEDAKDYDYEGSFEYKRANGSQYMYNENGSLVADKSRKIAYIAYDLNNNPQQIYFTNGNVTKYIYSASGQKLRAIHYTAKPNITRTWGKMPNELTLAQILLVDSTDYLLGGSLVMKNGKIDKILFEGGYAQATAVNKTTKDKFAFYYYNQDHLGNNREVVDAKGVVQQVTNYYPFGAPYADATAVKGAAIQPYKYNGKELDLMHGLNTYDYGARQYDPILARWDRMDPHSEDYKDVSPYVYCHNNPVMRIDPDGQDDYILDQNGALSRIRKTKDENDCIYSENRKNSITVNKSITTQLTANRKDYEGHYAIGSSQEDMTNLFSFVANNTKVEWQLSGYHTDGGDKFILNTQHHPGDVGAPQDIKGIKLTDMFVRAHNHWIAKDKNPSGYYDNGLSYKIVSDNMVFHTGYGGDVENAVKFPSRFKAAGKETPRLYMYHTPTQTLVKYGKYSIEKRTKVKNGKIHL